MTRLIPIGDRAWVDPDHIKFVQWSVPRHPSEDHLTGTQLHAAVTVETYHKVYRIPCATAAIAERIVAEVMAEIAQRELSRVVATSLPAALMRPAR